MMKPGVRCGDCMKWRPLVLETDGNGHVVDLTPACPCTVKRKRAWTVSVDADRRRACICQRCDRPTVGKPKVALYCERHRKEARAEAKRRMLAKVGDAYARKYRERNAKKVRRRARLYGRKHAKQRADYKRAWRKKNPDKVRAQKRRSALRGRNAERMRAYRERAARGEVQLGEKAPRNAQGERLCLGGCQTPLSGRPKLCAACRHARAHPDTSREQAA